MQNETKTNLEQALAYARKGWPVFPLHEINSCDCSCGRAPCPQAGKHSRVLEGVKEATTDPERIRAWWSGWPTANIGIATGIPQGATSGLHVIDANSCGRAQLADLILALPMLHETLAVRTGSGGVHFYFITDLELPSTCGKLAPFVDTHGEGGYVVAPPSRNQHGGYAVVQRNTIQPVSVELLVQLDDKYIGMNQQKQEKKEKEKKENSSVTQSVPRRPANVPPTPKKLIDLMERDIPDPAFVVPGMLCEGLTLICGHPKIGKSWLMLDLGLTVACGDQTTLDHFPVNQAPVFYITMEDSEGRLQSRVKKLLNGREVPGNFEYLEEWRPFYEGGITDLDTYMQANPATRLIIIDTLAAARGAGKNSGNVYLEDYTLIAALHEVALRHHVALVLVHHLNKSDCPNVYETISGSQGLTGAADTIIVLDRKEEETEGKLHLKGRDIQEGCFTISFASETCKWSIVDEGRHASSTYEAVLEVLDLNDSMTPAQIARVLDLKAKTVSKILQRMLEKDNVLVKLHHGRYALKKRHTQKQKGDGQLTLEEAREPGNEPAPIQESVKFPANHVSVDGTCQPEPGENTQEDEEWLPELDDDIPYDECPDEDTGWPEYVEDLPNYME